jgi:hypothetical protein
MSAVKQSLTRINVKSAADTSAAAITGTGVSAKAAKSVRFSQESRTADTHSKIEKDKIGNQKKWFDELCQKIESSKNYGKNVLKSIFIEPLDSNGQATNKRESENNAIYELSEANNNPSFTDILDYADGARLEIVYRITLSATNKDQPIKISKEDPHHPHPGDDIEVEGAALDFSNGNLQILITPKKALTLK